MQCFLSRGSGDDILTINMAGIDISYTMFTFIYSSVFSTFFVLSFIVHDFYIFFQTIRDIDSKLQYHKL